MVPYAVAMRQRRLSRIRRPVSGIATASMWPGRERVSATLDPQHHWHVSQ